MDEIRQTISAMKSSEAELRAQQIEESQQSMRQAMVTMVFTSFLAVAMLLVFYFQVSRGMRVRARLLANARAASLKAEEAFQTEQQARAEAEQANRLKDEFLATVSHELRTPLTSILGWSSMIRAGFLDQATEERALESIERNAQSQAQLVEDLLDVSRIITGKLRLDVHPVDLTTVIPNALDAVRPAADAKQIRLHSILDPRAGPVSGDAERLQQVIWNLLSNAIKFTPKGGRVEVRLERVNSHVEIIVSDTGQGISPEFLPHVFDRFRQADAGLTRTQSGLGLGLSIARHLVESHGGSITVDSAGEGRGSIFTVHLPLMGVRAVDAPDAADETGRAHPTAG
ncbi:MAG: HAMP domain-containing histidine kinase, partial [Acidobacteria bacterium]|nr:HAMP domain-containing histidine kinase [Acidobacteriota bacterium]